MVLPTNNLNTYFTNWSNKDVPLTGLGDITGLYNEIIEEQYGAHSNNPSINALIVKDIPLTFINDIQSIVLYNRRNALYRAIGLVIELYNTINDPDLTQILATTNIIETQERNYRFDFPAIGTYPIENFQSVDSTITNIISDTNATTEFALTNSNVDITGGLSCNTLTTTGNATVGGSLFLGDTNLTEDIDGLLTLDTNKRLIINRLTSASVITGENNCDYLNTTFQGKFGIPDSGNDLTLSGTQINFNSDSFISNSAGGNSGNHLVIFINGTEYKIKLENAS